MQRVLVTADPFHPETALEGFGLEDGNVGAVVSFTGYCRAASGAEIVSALELQHYPGFTERSIFAFATQRAERHALADWRIIHRVGLIAPRHAIVLVAAAARRRAEAFKAVEEIMDWLKTDGPFWKREHTETGARWIEPTARDYARRGGIQ